MDFAPLRFEPFLRPLVWGGRALGSRLGKSLPSPEPYGESWDVSDHALHRSVVAEGPCRGATLRQLMLEHGADLLGAARPQHKVFPWLIKFLDACDWLSVQVHPDKTAVQKLLPGEGSKTEAWLVIDAAPASRIYAGLLPGVGPKELRAALAAGRAQDCLHSFTPQPGDCVFLPAGTVHAVGGGVLFAEVQETSDATFRLFDWNRIDAQGKARPLHIEETFASIHWDRGPVEPIRAPSLAERPLAPLVRCPEFALDYLRCEGPLELGGTGKLRTLIVLAGQGSWSPGGTQSSAVGPGQAWVLPASLTNARLEARTPITGFLATLP